MSLLSPDTLSLYISSDRIQAVKASGLGQRPVEVHQRNASVQAADGWQGMTRVCLELVRQSQAQRLHIILSDKLARYACFPWQPQLRTAEEDLTLAMLNFDDVYGSNASVDWHFGFSNGSPGESRLMVAIPKSLFAVLQNHLGQTKPQVRSIRTAFSATLQTYSQRMSANGWLINLEEGRLTIGCWTQRAWSWIYSVHTAIDTPEALLERIQQELKMASTSLKSNQLLQIYIHAPMFEHLPFGSLSGVQFIKLETRSPEPGAKYAFPLMGVKA